MIKGVLFDFDGVLVDTESLYCQSNVQAFQQHGIPLTEEQYLDHWVRAGKTTPEYLETIHRYDADLVNVIREAKNLLYFAMLSSDVVIPGVHGILHGLARHYPLGLVTSSDREHVEHVLRMVDLASPFQIIVTANDVVQPKPHPEALLLASSKLGIASEHLVMVGDAEKDILAAYRAGMRSIAIPNRYTKSHDFSKATYVVKDLQEAVEIIKGMCGGF
ncbi:HAD family phosphatase [Candidatus Woesearchaeota archaeon]|nr:HAD family phosphatase [Candidatus Woesearchaeota archaeon]